MSALKALFGIIKIPLIYHCDAPQGVRHLEGFHFCWYHFLFGIKPKMVLNGLKQNCKHFSNSKTMKKILLQIHKVVGLAVGLLISLVCLTGAILVFEDELRELTRPDLYFVSSPQSTRLSPSVIAEHLNSNLEDDAVGTMTIPSDSTRTYTIRLQRGTNNVYVNPYTAQVVGERAKRDGFFGDVMRLHRWLLDSSRSWGKAIVGYGVLLFIVIIISGIVIWIPRSTHHIRQYLTIKTNANRKRMWLDVHRSFGIFLALPLLVLSITGLTWSFPWWRSTVYSLLGVEMKQTEHSHKHSNHHKEKEEKPLQMINYKAWDMVGDNITKRYPQWRTVTIEQAEVSLIQKSIWGNPRAPEKFRFDENTGALIEHTPYYEQPREKRVRAWIYAVHIGSWGGWLVKSLTFIVALLGGTLPLTGYYIYRKNNHSKQKKRQQMRKKSAS